ncbi:MAG: hypothetical protein SPC24_07765, partial [Alphaproteobacteria bacterium]|nr:hypothetical protein [Alphaproteobacteria bacterium]
LWLIASGKYYGVKQLEPTIIVKSEHSGKSLRDEFLFFLKNSVNLLSHIQTIFYFFCHQKQTFAGRFAFP